MSRNQTYKVHELFATDFKLAVARDIRAQQLVSYDLNLQGCEYQRHLQCNACRADEFLYFMDVLDMELRENDVAIVFMTTFGVANANADDVIYVVAND